jgi:hypothetical protein
MLCLLFLLTFVAGDNFFLYSKLNYHQIPLVTNPQKHEVSFMGILDQTHCKAKHLMCEDSVVLFDTVYKMNEGRSMHWRNSVYLCGQDPVQLPQIFHKDDHFGSTGCHPARDGTLNVTFTIPITLPLGSLRSFDRNERYGTRTNETKNRRE